MNHLVTSKSAAGWMSLSSFFDIPELVLLLGQHFLDRPSLLQCVQVSRGWHHSFISHLWETLDDSDDPFWNRVFEDLWMDREISLGQATVPKQEWTPLVQNGRDEVWVKEQFRKYGGFVRHLKLRWPLAVECFLVGGLERRQEQEKALEQAQKQDGGCRTSIRGMDEDQRKERWGTMGLLSFKIGFFLCLPYEHTMWQVRSPSRSFPAQEQRLRLELQQLQQHQQQQQKGQVETQPTQPQLQPHDHTWIWQESWVPDVPGDLFPAEPIVCTGLGGPLRMARAAWQIAIHHGSTLQALHWDGMIGDKKPRMLSGEFMDRALSRLRRLKSLTLQLTSGPLPDFARLMPQLESLVIVGWVGSDMIKNWSTSPKEEKGDAVVIHGSNLRDLNCSSRLGPRAWTKVFGYFPKLVKVELMGGHLNVQGTEVYQFYTPCLESLSCSSGNFFGYPERFVFHPQTPLKRMRLGYVDNLLVVSTILRRFPRLDTLLITGTSYENTLMDLEEGMEIEEEAEEMIQARLIKIGMGGPFDQLKKLRLGCVDPRDLCAFLPLLPELVELELDDRVVIQEVREAVEKWCPKVRGIASG